MNCMLFIKRINNKVKNIVNIMIWKMCYGRKLVLHKPVFFRKAMTINISQEGRIKITLECRRGIVNLFAARTVKLYRIHIGLITQTDRKQALIITVDTGTTSKVAF